MNNYTLQRAIVLNKELGKLNKKINQVYNHNSYLDVTLDGDSITKSLYCLNEISKIIYTELVNKRDVLQNELNEL